VFHQGKVPPPRLSPSRPEHWDRADETQTPEEALESSYQALQNSLAIEILDAVRKMPPEAFEQLVVTLLVAMGYGGSLQDAGKAVGRPATRELTDNQGGQTWPRHGLHSG